MSWRLPDDPRRMFQIISIVAAVGGGAIILLYVVNYLISLYR